MLPLDEAAREYKVNAGSGVASPGGGVEVQASWPQCKPSFHNKSLHFIIRALALTEGGGGPSRDSHNRRKYPLPPEQNRCVTHPHVPRDGLQ